MKKGGSSLIIMLEKRNGQLERVLTDIVKLQDKDIKSHWADCWNCHQKFPYEHLNYPTTFLCPHCRAKELLKTKAV